MSLRRPGDKKRPFVRNERPKSREETPRVGCERPEVQPTFHVNNDAFVCLDHQHARKAVPNIPGTRGS